MVICVQATDYPITPFWSSLVMVHTKALLEVPAIPSVRPRWVVLPNTVQRLMACKPQLVTVQR